MKQKIFLLLTLAMIFALSSCSNKEKQESSAVPSEKPVELKPVDQTAQLSGHVGRGGVHMTLTIKGDLVEGEYSYDKYNSPLKLQGKLEEDGHMELHEVNASGRPTGHFDGYYGKDYGYIGEFVNFQGTRSPFNLTIDDVTDNAGDGEGRGFLAPLPSNSPAAGGGDAAYEGGAEDYSGDYDSGDYGSAYDDANDMVNDAKRQARAMADDAHEQAKQMMDDAYDEVYGKTGAKVVKKLSGYDDAVKEYDRSYEESKEALGY